MGGGKTLRQRLHRRLHKDPAVYKATMYHVSLHTYGIDWWMPAMLVDRLTTKLVDRLTNCSTAVLVNGLTAKLMNRLTAKLVVVNLVKLHFTNFSGFLNYFLTIIDSFLCLNLFFLPLV